MQGYRRFRLEPVNIIDNINISYPLIQHLKQFPYMYANIVSTYKAWSRQQSSV